LSRLDVEAILREDGALLQGHFELRSGLHSDRYLQCAKVLQHPEHAAEVAGALARALPAGEVDLVVGPATGGIIVAHELARALGVRSVFAERREDEFTLRRGFEVRRGERAVVAEDVVTTGGAVGQVVDLVRAEGGEVAAVAAIVNRSGKNPFDAPFAWLYDFEAETWPPDECPLCARGERIDKPGSGGGS